MKKFAVGALALLAFSIFASSVFAASSTFFKKASEYYNKNCKKNIGKIDKSTAVICYLFDKVHELDIKLNSQSDLLSDIQDDVATNSADIVILKGRRSIIDVKATRGSFFTTSSTTPVPTGNKVDATCDVSCLLLVNYYVDTRNSQSSPNPAGFYNFYSIFIDGVDQAVFTQASFPVPNVAVPLALNGTFVVSPGTHTVEIYAYVNGGTLESHESGLQVLAIEESSTPAPTPSEFNEDFNGPDLDTNIWEFFSTNGGNYSFDNGFIVVPGGSSMFYIRTKNNPFPPSDPFTVEFGIQFTSPAPSGDGVALGLQQQNDYDPSNIPVSFWEDNASGLVVSRFGLKVADLVGGVDTNYHVGKIVYDGDKYLVYNDGVLKYTSPSSATAKTIWFGNPYCCSSTWTGFKLDYIKVSQP